MPSSTPAGGDPPFSDSDDDLENGHEPLSAVDCKGQKKVVDLTLKDKPIVEEETGSFTVGQPSQRRKRSKRAARVVISESESDDDVPISRLRRSPDTPVKSTSVDGDHNSRNFTPRRRRLKTLGDIQDNKVSGKCLEKSDNMNDTMLESLDGFIVEDSYVSENSVSNGNDMSEHDGSLSGGGSDESESVSEGSMTYVQIISGYRRERKEKLKWKYESEMLADFGKSDELCMKAVCVLYRQQTSEEKSYKATINRNGRGFSHFHASSGTALAEFLTDGDPDGDMNKTVEELRKFNPNGVEECQKLANHYSKQLFEIYKNEEDLLFHP